MPFADDLLRDARHLAERGGKNPRQSSLRRAVSTGYYALFHLLIADFVLNWKRADQRVRLGRMFEHSKMSRAGFRRSNAGALTPVEADLKLAVETFSKLQDYRYTADYDFERKWSRTDVNTVLNAAEDAFQCWRNIRKDKIAQDHLLTMFGARRDESSFRKRHSTCLR